MSPGDSNELDRKFGGEDTTLYHFLTHHTAGYSPLRHGYNWCEKNRNLRLILPTNIHHELLKIEPLLSCLGLNYCRALPHSLKPLAVQAGFPAAIDGGSVQEANRELGQGRG